MTLYHKDIYMPEDIKNLSMQTYDDFIITYHAQEQAENKDIIILESFSFSGCNIVEAEVIDSTVTKIVIRLSYGQSQDVCYVFRKDIRYNKPVLITCWLNSKSDNHSTLDHSKYSKG
jgi:hypothetical protein